jgi:hypothetical protein
MGFGGDDGDNAGRGFVGMRERASMHGAAVEARQRQSGSFVVHARVPLDSAFQ